MDRKCYYDKITHRTRVVTRWGDGVEVKRHKNEVQVPDPPEGYGKVARAVVRQLTPEQLSHREVLKRTPIQKLITAAIEQGLFDRVKIDG